jgi:putative DNA primase/helicase
LPAALDPSPWLFNCPNGTIDLRTGNMKGHERGDLITRMSPVDFDPVSTCPIWDETISRIFAGDSGLIRFVRQIFGMALTGDVSTQILPIFFGEGGNGKSTVLNALLDIMGPDYAIVAPPGLLFSKNNEGHPTDKASLFGMRLVVDFESAEGARLNEALVKQLTGSDRISARRMREDFWTFLPTHKLVLCTNNQPAITETKNAIWRRLKLVPFTVEIPESEQKADLPKLLQAEFPGILAWCVRGCVDWVTNGLKTPETVARATAEYRAEEDALGSFIADECITGPGLRVKASKLYHRYRSNMDRSGLVSSTMTAFGRSMTKKGYEKISSNGKWYLGIDLRSDDGDSSDGSY